MSSFVEGRMSGVSLHHFGQMTPEILGIATVVRFDVECHLQVVFGGRVWKSHKIIYT